MQSNKDIPIIGACYRWLLLPTPLSLVVIFATCCSLLIGSTMTYGKGIDYYYANDNNNQHVRKLHTSTVPVYFSEYKLRSLIEASNAELRQLKRDFIKSITSVYFNMKSDPQIGITFAKRGETAAIASVLMAEEFADIAIKKHIIQRRVTSGLKVAFLRFLPLTTLQRLIENFKSYAWLSKETKVDLRPKFSIAKEKHYVQLYTLIGLRANARAADDIMTLTSDNIKRILKTVQWFLIEQNKGAKDLNVSEAEAMRVNVAKILKFYMSQVVDHQRSCQEEFEKYLVNASGLVELVGGKKEFIRLVDNIIDEEALDIDLSEEAEKLDLPPTISEQMMNNVERKWIPKRVLESVNEDRVVLLRHKSDIKPLVGLEAELNDVDLSGWCSNSLSQVTKQFSH